MANMLSQYGIKEVADVTFYKVENGEIQWDKPQLYLDTLKVSTIEQTAENVSARGGKGNPELVTWDYNKEITLTLEDALFSAKSLAFMFGTNAVKNDATGGTPTVTSMIKVADVEPDSTENPSNWIYTRPGKDDNGNAITTTVTTDDIKAYLLENGEAITTGSNTYGSLSYTKKAFVKTETVEGSAVTTTVKIKGLVIQQTVTNSYTITIDSDKFPGQYAIVGDTFARPQGSTKDEMFQFIIYNAKVNSEVTFTLEAEGDPTTFNMSVRVLKPENDNHMMKLIKYDFGS